jgi:predicted DNA-binding transcriptional regulator YafY
MNRIDRVSAILIQLQSKKVVKGQEIADRFNISLRTVYRDVKTLEEAGVPVIGEAGHGFSIMEGFRLPPVMFTKEEALAFLTAGKMMEKFTDPSLQQHYKSALFKIKAVLRSTEKDLLEHLDDHIAVLENTFLPAKATDNLHLQTLLKSITQKELLQLKYFTNQTQQYSERTVEPIGIFYQNNYWYLMAWCRLRNDYRNFRTDRISTIKNTGQKFTTQHPSLQSFLQNIKSERALHTIIVRVDKSTLPYFGDQKYYNGFVSQQEIGDKVDMTFVAGSLTGFSKFFLLFGEHAEIIQPLELKQLIAQNLKAIQKKLAQ